MGDAAAETMPDVEMFVVQVINDKLTPAAFVIDVVREVFGASHEGALAIVREATVLGRGTCGVYPRDEAAEKICAVARQAQRGGHPLLCVMAPHLPPLEGATVVKRGRSNTTASPRFVRNLVLWAIIALLVVVGYDLVRQPRTSLPAWLLSWWPFFLFVLVPFFALMRIARSNSSKLTAHSEKIAAAAHIDAQHMIALLSQIRNQQIAQPTPAMSDPAGS
jgi:ATP-dependent Clp protease adapter protein ClpS